MRICQKFHWNWRKKTKFKFAMRAPSRAFPNADSLYTLYSVFSSIFAKKSFFVNFCQNIHFWAWVPAGFGSAHRELSFDTKLLAKCLKLNPGDPYQDRRFVAFLGHFWPKYPFSGRGPSGIWFSSSRAFFWYQTFGKMSKIEPGRPVSRSAIFGPSWPILAKISIFRPGSRRDLIQLIESFLLIPNFWQNV